MGAAVGSAHSHAAQASTAPALGVTLVLAVLWLLASGVGMVRGEPWPVAAAALDPGRAGSITDSWAIGLLALATILALSQPGSRLLALTPALLLLGEAGEVHLCLADLLTRSHDGVRGPLLAKLASSLALDGLALAPLVSARHRYCFGRTGCLRRLALQICCGEMVAVALDLSELGVGPQVRAVLLYCEEWLEVIVYAVLAQAYLALVAHSSYYETEKAKLASCSAVSLSRSSEFCVFEK